MACPLEAVRIVDMTSALIGPHATRILGDFGADAIPLTSYRQPKSDS